MDKKEKIIIAALEEFVERGYSGARIRTICQTAKVNLAAINYYFGGKENLYKAAMEYALALPDPFIAMKEDLENNVDPECSLKKLIISILRHDSATDMLFRCRYRLFIREMISPSREFMETFLPTMRPRFRLLCEMISRIKGHQTDEDDIIETAMLTLAQCLFFFNRPAIEGITGNPDFSDNRAENIAQKIINAIKSPTGAL